MKFESFANSKRYKTYPLWGLDRYGLRALLIQKDTKLIQSPQTNVRGLRALLIQKDTKHIELVFNQADSLRALLIQKDTKPRYD